LWARSYRRIESVHYIPGARLSDTVRGTRDARPAWYVADATEYTVFSNNGTAAFQVHDQQLAHVTEHRRSLPVWFVSHPLGPAERRQERFFTGGPGMHHFGGIGYASGDAASTAGNPYYWVAAPHWLIGLAAAALPTLQLIARPRRRLGLCPVCGYDLTGNVSGTCPECGTPVTAKATA
jgi:hypothetical protein